MIHPQGKRVAYLLRYQTLSNSYLTTLDIVQNHNFNNTFNQILRSKQRYIIAQYKQLSKLVQKYGTLNQITKLRPK